MKRIEIRDSNAFEGEIREFEGALKNIKEIFQSEKNNIEKINKTEIWTSMTQEAVYEKNIEFQKNFGPVEEAIQVYIDFMKKTLSDYIRFEEVTGRNIDNQVESLDVRV